MKDLVIVKIGGNIIENKEKLLEFLQQFRSIPHPKILVHGGGKIAGELSERLNIPVKRVEGRRITCAETLDITVMVYAGLINKKISAMLNGMDERAIGLSGSDLGFVPSVKRPVSAIDYGFVGDILIGKINTKEICLLLENNVVPVVACITSDAGGQLLNTNADSVASAIASAFTSAYNVQLVFGFEKPGVLHHEIVMRKMDSESYRMLKHEKIVSDGMIPKLDNAFEAIARGVKSVVIGQATDLKKLIEHDSGTEICI
jgi:acetylglutamate kinase